MTTVCAQANTEGARSRTHETLPRSDSAVVFEEIRFRGLVARQECAMAASVARGAIIDFLLRRGGSCRSSGLSELCGLFSRASPEGKIAELAMNELLCVVRLNDAWSIQWSCLRERYWFLHPLTKAASWSKPVNLKGEEPQTFWVFQKEYWPEEAARSSAYPPCSLARPWP